MFGFKGSTQSKMEWEMAGVDVGSAREMIFGLGVFDGYDAYAVVDFDADNQGSATTFAGFSPTYPIVKLPLPAPDLFGNDVYSKFQTISISGVVVPPYITGQYPTDAPLSPVNRKQSHIINRPELVHSIGFEQRLNNAARSAASNVATGGIDIDWQQFSNAKRFIINEAYITGITKNFPESLEEIYFREANVLTEAPKFPKNVENVYLAEIPAGDFITNINTKLEDLTKLKKIYFTIPAPYGATYAGPTSTLSGDLDLSMTDQLEEVIISISLSLKSITLDPTLTGMTIFHASNTGITGSTTFENVLDNNPNLNAFNIGINRIYTVSAWTRNFINADINSSMVYFLINRGSIVGDINFTDSKTNMKDLRLGSTLSNNAASNTHQTVNISGLTELSKIYLQGCSIEDLELPNTTLCNYFTAYSNKLDITTNPNIITLINQMTPITLLQLGLTVTGGVNPLYGQDSTNGLGADVNLSGLTNMTTCAISNCKISSSITLPLGNKITRLEASDGDYDTINNLSGHTNMSLIYLCRAPNFDTSISGFTKLRYYVFHESGISNIDASTRSETNTILFFSAYNCPSLTTITFPTTDGFFNSGSANVMNGSNSTGLTTINNVENVGYSTLSIASGRRFTFNNCALDMVFPFGTNSFLPANISLQDNSMSTTNVDNNINNIYTNRALNWGSGSPALNISGTNGAATGTYQAPAGFVLGVSDGTPTSAKEQIYVLVNNYSWVITYN